MRHPDNVDRKLKKNYIEKKQSISFEYGSNVERMDPKAYARFKAINTDYGTKKCFYGDQKNYCNPKCIFWMSCKHGKHESEWKGGRKVEQRTEKKEETTVLHSTRNEDDTEQ